MKTTRNTKVVINLANVVIVYSGQANKCHCGCTGRYRYAAEHRAFGSENRGYEVTDDEVSDRAVKAIVTKVQRILDGSQEYGEVESIYNPPTKNDASQDWIACTVGNRDYTIYFKDGATDTKYTTVEVKPEVVKAKRPAMKLFFTYCPANSAKRAIELVAETYHIDLAQGKADRAGKVDLFIDAKYQLSDATIGEACAFIKGVIATLVA